VLKIKHRLELNAYLPNLKPRQDDVAQESPD
jgi:hypothetical protein